MPRPVQPRRVDAPPPCGWFKPAGVPLRGLEAVMLTVDEYEALRLSDHEALYQEAVAERMGVSRPTVGRILEAARRKVAEALVCGKAIRIEGGSYATGELRRFACAPCGFAWDLPYGGGRPGHCPRCGAAPVERIDEARGGGRGQGHGRGRSGGGCHGRGHGRP